MVFKKNYDCLPNRDLNTRTLKLSQYFYQSSNCVFYFKSNMIVQNQNNENDPKCDGYIVQKPLTLSKKGKPG